MCLKISSSRKLASLDIACKIDVFLTESIFREKKSAYFMKKTIQNLKRKLQKLLLLFFFFSYFYYDFY